MRIEAIRLKNFRAFREVELRDIPPFAVFVGANGTGKSTLFSVFGFLQDAMATNVTAALGRLGGSRGFAEVRSRGCQGPIEIELAIRADLGRSKASLVTYSLAIDEDEGRPVVARELLKHSPRGGGPPRSFVDFSRGEGHAMSDDLVDDALGPLAQTLKSPDILAIKGLAQFEQFRASAALGTLVENWHLYDLHVGRARPEQEAGHAEHLSREGENLSLVVDYLHRHHPGVFRQILDRLSRRVPGVKRVESKVTEEGRVLLKFTDGAFEDPFLARSVSDGTIKMLAYLVLLHDPKPHPLLCVEEPENQLYPSLLSDLAEEFRSYAVRGGQVFVSTHSPDFLNAAELDEAYWLVKENGFTTIRRAVDDPQLVAYVNEGDKLGFLWKQGLLEGADPR